MAQPRHDITVESDRGRSLAFLRRRAVEVLTAIYLVTIIYNSLVPLDFSASPSRVRAAAVWFLGLPVVRVGIPDAVSNIAFYIPLGVLVCAALVKAGWGRWLAISVTVLASAVLSYLMEFLQLWSQTRLPTTFDCLYNIIGASAGALASRPLVLFAGHAHHRFTRDLRERPSLVLTAVLGFALAVAALLPLDVTFSVERLHKAAKVAHVVPFEKLQSITERHAADAGPIGFAAGHIPLRDWWMLTLDYGTWSVLYAALALAGCYYLRTHCRMGAFRATLHVLGMCAVYSLGSSALQFFVISRGLDVTVPIFQMSGALLGTLLQPIVLNRMPPGAPGPSFRPLEPEQVRPLLALGLTIVTFGIVLRETTPFRFETSAGSVAAQVKAIDWLPMGTYQVARFHVAVDDVVRKLLRFAVLGALIAAARNLKTARAGTCRPWRVGARVALGITGLEILQVLLPSRVPVVTDVFLAWFGTAAGVYLYQLGRLWWHKTLRAPGIEKPYRIDYRVELGEPGEETAPRERVPTVTRRRK